MRYRLMNYAPAIDRWAEIRFNMLTVSDLKDQIPDYSKDIKLNLSSLIINSDMDEKLVYGCALASALALDNEKISDIFIEECKSRFDNDYVEAVKGTVCIMTLNNVWYKYREAMPNNEMKMAPQKMRVNIMREYAGLDMELFESLSLCISAVNGCQFCVTAHSELLLNNGKSKDYILNIGRIASTIVAVSKALSI